MFSNISVFSRTFRKKEACWLQSQGVAITVVYACVKPYHPGRGNHNVRGEFFLEPFPLEAEYYVSFPVSALFQQGN